MRTKIFTITLAVLLLSGCSSGLATDESATIDDFIASSVALTLEAAAPEPTPQIVEASSTTTPAPALGGDPSMLNTDYENALPIEMQIATGTLMLAGTAQDFTPEQAAQLIPLWQALRGLIETESGQELIAEQVANIIRTMSLEQITSIAAMQLTQENMVTVFQELGVESSGAQGRDSASGAPRGNGEMPAGGPPSGHGGQGQPDGQARDENNQPSLPPILMDAIIEYLSTKLQ